MERHRCKLCYRNFSNGRALGGHMRSHMIHLSPSRKQYRVQETDQLGPAIHSCSSSQGEVVLPEFESDGETSDPFGTKTSKRPRKDRYLCSSNEELSSVSDVTAEEAVARCLMMLSRDTWEAGHDENDDVSEDSSPLMKAERGKNKVKGKYKCGTCNKVFKSYQALGGHRASYKKIKADVATAHGVSPAAAAAEEKVHECPFCHRVFASGQALGGHKRSHFMGSNNNNNSNFSNFSKILNFDMIDLNLPAPVEDDDEINFSQQ